MVVSMRYKKKRNFALKLVLCLATISISGLFVMSIVVNTIVRNIIYSQVTSAVHSDVRAIATGIDTTLNIGNHIVYNLTSAFTELGGDYIEPLSEIILDDYEFIARIYVGFSDGSHYGSGDWSPDEGWDPRTRPWYDAAVAAQGDIITTAPFVSLTSDYSVISTIAKYTPDIDGMEAVVALSITDDYIVSMVNQYQLDSGGYLMLIGPNGELVAHPDYDNIISNGANIFLSDIPNGEVLTGLINSEKSIDLFEDTKLSTSYLMPFELGSTGWTLVAVIPDVAISAPVSQHITAILIAFVIVLSAIFAIIMIFMFFITRDMEEGRIAEERLRLIIDNMPLVANIHDSNNKLVECNEAAVTLFDLKSKSEYISQFFDFSPETQPDGVLSKEKMETNFKKTMESGYMHFEWMHQDFNGEPIPTEVTLIRVDWRGEGALLAFVQDMRDFYKFRETERNARKRLQAMLDSSPLLCTIFDEDSNIIEANQEAIKLFEIADKQQYIDDYFAFSPKLQPNGRSSREYALEMLRVAYEKGHSRFDWTYMNSRGEHIPCEEVVMSVKLEDEHLLIAHTRDLRGFYKQKEAELAAITDVLTGAYNRRYLMDAASKKLNVCKDKNLDFSLLMIDADYFKKINDTHGHLVGDEVLKILVSRSRYILRRDTFIARYGGEEFVVVLPGTDQDGAISIAERIRSNIDSSPFNIGDLSVNVTVSIGVASKVNDSATLVDLIDNADKALYHAKQSGRNAVVHYEDKKGNIF